MRVRAAALVCLMAYAPVACSAVPHADGPDRGNGNAEASCVGPFLDDDYPNGHPDGDPPTVRPGERLELHGFWYTSTCNDTGDYRTPEPLPDVILTVTYPGGATARLGPFTPSGDTMGFAAAIDVPADAPQGTATVADSQDYPFEFTFAIRR